MDSKNVQQINVYQLVYSCWQFAHVRIHTKVRVLWRSSDGWVHVCSLSKAKGRKFSWCGEKSVLHVFHNWLVGKSFPFPFVLICVLWKHVIPPTALHPTIWSILCYEPVVKYAINVLHLFSFIGKHIDRWFPIKQRNTSRLIFCFELSMRN